MPPSAQAADAPGARPFSLVRYLLVVFGLSWPLQLASVLLARNLLSLYALNSLSMLMVAVASFIAGRYLFRDGFAGAGWSWGRPRAYLLVAALLAALWVAPTVVEGALGRLRPLSGVTGRQAGWAAALLLVTIIPAFGEEFGWRGYMLPRIAASAGLRRAIILHAFIWWLWHLPVLMGGEVRARMIELETSGLRAGLSAAFQLTPTLLVSLLPALLHAVVMAAIWARGRSLAVAVVYHAGYDALRDILQLTVGLNATTGLWVNALLLVLGALLLWRGDWQGLEDACRRAGQPPPPPAAPRR